MSVVTDQAHEDANHVEAYSQDSRIGTYLHFSVFLLY